MLVGRSENYTKRVKTGIIRRGGSGEGRERKGDCIQRDAVHLFVVQVVT